ncbi:MAG: TIGR02996 domain-containing protein [Alphaproteobacteria bacterium]|nr:TIGR02996 domain-containing protein [Alphaproteobacteria bacterium]
MSLEDVTAALDAEDWDGALAALLEAWREHRAVELEEALVALSDWVATGLEPLPETDFDDAWTQLAAAVRPVDVPRLLERMDAMPAGRIPGRVGAMARFGDDPRIGRKYLAMIAKPPTTSTSNQGAWVALFQHLPGCIDGRAAPFLDQQANTRGGTSQFWGKLMKWCEGASDAVSDPPPLPDALRDDLAALRGRIDALAGGAPPVVGAAAPAQVASAGLPSLGQALAALKKRDFATALDGLVGFWATHRTAAIADLIDRLDALVPAEPPKAATAKALDALWLELAAGARPSAVGGLLAVAGQGKAGDREARLEAMPAWTPDPRVYRFAESHFADYLIGARKRLWAAVQDILVHHLDPRREEAWQQREDRHQAPGILHRYQEIRRQIQRTAPAYHAALAAILGPSDADRAVLDEFDATLATMEDKADASGVPLREQEEALVRAILASPGDDGPRAVYADWLIEHGQPERGELIELEIQLKKGAKVKGRRDKLLKKETAAIHGPLTPVLGRDPVLEDGLLVKARGVSSRKLETLGDAEREALYTDLRWATVVELSADYRGGLEGLLARAPLWSLRTLERITVRALGGIARRDDTLGVRTLDLLGGDTPASDAEWALLDAVAARLPELEDVHFMGWEHGGRSIPPSAFFASPLLAKVKVLRNGHEGGSTGGTTNLAMWLGRMAAVQCPVPRLSAWGPDVGFEATLRGDGRYDVQATVVRLQWERQIEEITLHLRTARACPQTTTFDIAAGTYCDPEMLRRVQNTLQEGR